MTALPPLASLLLGLGGIAAAGGGLWLANRDFEQRIAALRDDVTAPLPPPAAGPELPDIVRAYALRAGGRPGGPAFVHLRHRAVLATARQRPMMPIAADQWVASYGPKLLWVGRGRMAGLPVTVVDSFDGSEGQLEARLLGTFPVAGGSGPDFARGELQRYLSELPLHPDAILNNAALNWRQLDAAHVEVTARSAHGEASLAFGFDENGRIVGCEAADRPMTVGRSIVPTRWRGSFSDYRELGGRRIPTHGEVGWVLPDGLFTYWRGDVVAYEPSGTDVPGLSGPASAPARRAAE